MQMVRTRFGQNLNTAVTQFVVFRGEGILVDSYFADGRFRRQLSTRKPVNVDLAAVGARGRSSQSLQVVLQIVGMGPADSTPAEQK